VSRRRAFGARAALAVLLAAATVWAWTHRELFDLTVIEVALGGVGAWAPGGFVLLFALATVLFVPGSVFGLAGGFLFGPVFGTLWNLLGATLGATLAFLAARYVASDWVERRAGERLRQLLAGVQAEGWRFVALMRLVPLAPFNLLNYALGLTRIRIAEYVITTLVCMVPGTAAYAWLGHAGREAAAGDSAALHYGVVGLGLLAAALMLPRLIGRLRAKPVKWISVAELRRRVDTDGDVTVVDVRDPDEFTGTSRHIPRAQHTAERSTASAAGTHRHRAEHDCAGMPNRQALRKGGRRLARRRFARRSRASQRHGGLERQCHGAGESGRVAASGELR
jgi:uncharacterized membrane protein YdjX (TVP38/TMEM64 family)